MRFLVILAAAAFFSVPLTAAEAGGPAAKDFEKCDGYDAPKNAADGMFTQTMLLGAGVEQTDFGAVQIAPPGETTTASCRAALADPRLKPEFWRRRAHLLQVLAFNLLSLDKPDEGLRALDESDAQIIGHEDRFFQDSASVINKLLRGLALFQLHRDQDAIAQLDAAERARPYSQTYLKFALAIRSAYQTSLTGLVADLRRNAALDPQSLGTLFRLSMVRNDFAAAADYAPKVSFDIPTGHGGWTVEGEDQRAYERIKDRADVFGAAAYAYLAVGDPGGSATLLSGARQDLNDAIEPPSPNGAGKISKWARQDYEQRVAAATAAGTTLDKWAGLIALRQQVSGQPMAVAMPELEKDSSRRSMVIIDLLRQPRVQNPQENAEREKLLATIVERRDATILKSQALDFKRLSTMLPRVEQARGQPKIRKLNWLISDNGFTIRPIAGEGYVKISFSSENATLAMAEEAAMLAAARYTVQEGRDRFIIRAQSSLQRLLVGNTSGFIQGGFEASLTILPLDPAKKLPPLASGAWREIKADAVIAALSAKYSPPEKTGN